MNTLIISGTLTKPEYSHTILGIPYYVSYIESKRISGVVDRIPIITAESSLPNEATILGQLRTRNNNRHLQMYIFPEYIYDYEADQNSITLEGYICKTPEFRTTPLGKQITNLLVAVHRPYEQSDYIPCIAWTDKTNLKIGDQVTLEGRIQSRKHKKGIAYEVSLTRAEKRV